MNELFFFGNYDVKETVAPTIVPTVEPTIVPTVEPTVAPTEIGNAYLSFTLGTAPYEPMNNNFVSGIVQYTSPDNNYMDSALFKLNDGRGGECNIKCYNSDLYIYAYLDAPYKPIILMKSIICTGNISSYNPIGTIIPEFTGNKDAINVVLNF